MSDLKIEGFKSSDVLAVLGAAFEQFSETEKKAQLKKVNGIFELRITNEEGKKGVWTIDMKKTGTVYKGAGNSKPDVVIILSDDTFVLLSEGKLDGQKAFVTGKLSINGNMMLATKLDGVLKSAKVKAKL